MDQYNFLQSGTFPVELITQKMQKELAFLFAYKLIIFYIY